MEMERTPRKKLSKMNISDTELHIINELYKFITIHYIKNISIDDLLSQYPISASTLRRGFKDLFGVSIDHFRLRVGMAEARKMLETGHLVKEITLNFGYKTAGSFGRAFKKIYGVTPTSCSKVFSSLD